MSKEMGVPPSRLVGLLSGSVRAFYFDRGIWLWGNKLEADMNRAEQGSSNAGFARAARLRVFNRYMGEKDDTKGAYRDPVKSIPQKAEEPGEIVLGAGSFG